MTSPASASAAGIPASVFRKCCKIKRCPELVPFGRLLCDRHEAMVPENLSAAIEAANKRFIAAAEDGDVGRGMRALEAGLLAERAIRTAIEKMEASDV